MKKEYDVCVIGSGAGGGPVALALSEAGYQVLVLEKGPWFTEKDFFLVAKGVFEEIGMPNSKLTINSKKK